MFKKTGNMINLSYDELAGYVQTKLKDYDRVEAMTDVPPAESPYKNPIVYVTKEGKYVQVPEFVQRKVIKEWTEGKTTEPMKDIKEPLTVEKEQNYTFWYFLIAIIILIAIISRFC
jgi:hypothetical protein